VSSAGDSRPRHLNNSPTPCCPIEAEASPSTVRGCKTIRVRLTQPSLTTAHGPETVHAMRIGGSKPDEPSSKGAAKYNPRGPMRQPLVPAHLLQLNNNTIPCGPIETERHQGLLAMKVYATNTCTHQSSACAYRWPHLVGPTSIRNPALITSRTTLQVQRCYRNHTSKNRAATGGHNSNTACMWPPASKNTSLCPQTANPSLMPHACFCGLQSSTQ
jgi:hypothetical protein